MLKALATRRYVSLVALAEEHGVTERTIRRDVYVLQGAGFRIFAEEYDATDSGKLAQKRWRLSRSERQYRELAALISA